MTNYYNILGVSKTATADEIKQAYRRLASKEHPDKGGDTARFQEIQTAYDTLSDPNKRAQHDNPGININRGFRPQGPNAHEFDLDSVFKMFGARFTTGQPQQQMMTRMTLWIQLSDVATGGSRTVSIGTPHGNSVIDIEIPQGIADGDNVQYQGLAPGGGDLVITYRVHPSPKWQRDGLNVLTDHPIVIWDLILGSNTTVRDLLNKELSLVIPKNCQPGTVLRCQGKGLERKGHTTGDLMVRLQARLPETIPTELEEMIRKKFG